LLTLAAVVAAFTGVQWFASKRLRGEVTSRLGAVDQQLAGLANVPAAAAAPPADAVALPAQQEAVKVNTGGAPSKGSAEAPIVIAVFSDFQCEHCAPVSATLDRILQDYGSLVRVAWINNPLPMHPDAPLAHRAAIAAQLQGKFWEYHDRLFAERGRFSREDLLRHARELGLDLRQFEQDLDGTQVAERLAADMAEAASFDIQAAPAFLVNNRYIYGAHRYEAFADLVEAELDLLELPRPPGLPARPPAEG
jgi:protein-disulfide isomerase